MPRHHGQGSASQGGEDDAHRSRRDAPPPKQGRFRRFRGVAIVVVLALVVGGFVVARGLLRGSPGSVDGKVLWHADLAAPATLGPNGWIAYKGKGGWGPFGGSGQYELRNVHSGREFDLGKDPRLAYILPDGSYLSDFGGISIHRPSGKEVARIDTDAIGHGVSGLAGLVPGSPEIVGVSKKTVALMTCYAPKFALLSSGAKGGHAVIAGFRRSSGHRVWSRDTGAGCHGTQIYHRPDQALGAIGHILIYDGATATVLRLDDGSVRAKWRNNPKYSVILQGDLALRRIGKKAEVVDLATRRTITTTQCPGLEMMSPGSTANLSPEAVLAIDCADDVRIYDRSTKRFVTVDAPPIGENRRIPDGGSVVYDRYVLSRAGESVTITDALSGTEVGHFSAPESMQIQTNAARGRVLLMYVTTDADKAQHAMVAVDLRTGRTLISDSDELDPGASVDPDGFALVSAGGSVDVHTRYGHHSEMREQAWLVGAKGSPADG